MDSIRNFNFRVTHWLSLLSIMLVMIVLSSCAISFTFNGASIDYTKTRTISIATFTNVAELVHPPLAQEFSEKLRDKYVRQTKLRLLREGGDMHIEGEIVGYQLTPMSIAQDAFSAETKLTLTINVRFNNQANEQENFEKQFTSFRVFDSNRMITDAQNELLPVMMEEIVDNIFNDTVARW